jgi:hypothetical protein
MVAVVADDPRFTSVKFVSSVFVVATALTG